MPMDIFMGMLKQTSIRIWRSFLLVFMMSGVASSGLVFQADAKMQSPSTLPPTPIRYVAVPPFLFGVMNNQGTHYADEWSRGVRATTFEFHWSFYEPQEGVYDQAYIDHMRQSLMVLKQQGWFVQMIPGVQYAPDWVYLNYPDVYFMNQYGDKYSPDPNTDGDYRVINAPFNPTARNLIARYLSRIFQDFDQADPDLRFDSIRIGGGVQGELRYPQRNWNGQENSYWAFDPSAQNPAISGIPPEVVSWRPGIDANPGSVGHGQLIVNPGFELDHEYFHILGWTPDDEVLASLTTESPHSGSVALMISINSENRVHQFVKVSPNTIYQFGGWLKSQDGIGSARFIYTQHDQDTLLIKDAPYGKLESTNTGWTYVEGSLTISPTTKFLKVEMDGSRAGTYYFDDLWLKREGEPDSRDRDITVPLAFYDWYVQALTDYQNWQITEIRRYFDGQLDLIYPGKGSLMKPVMEAVVNDLSGDGWSENSSALYSATAFERHVSGLNTTEDISLYVTGIETPPDEEVNDNSPYPNNWSAAHWIAYLARSRGLPVWGENSGADSLAILELSASRMMASDFEGLMWGFESELYAYSNEWATIDDYEAIIDRYSQLEWLFLPFVKYKP